MACPCLLQAACEPPVVDGRIQALVMATTPRGRSALDSVLSELYHSAYEALASWLSRFASGLLDVSMRDLFSLLVHDAGPAVMAGWYVRFLTADSRRLRAAAVRLLAQEEPPRLDRGAIASLSSWQFEAVMHQLAGMQVVPAQHIAHLALSLAAIRPDDAQFLKEIVVELASLYPGAFEDEIARSRSTSTRDGGVSAAMEEAVLCVLEERSVHLEKIFHFPEVTSASPGLREYQLFEDRQRRRIMKEAQGRSVFLQFASRQPIACGEGTMRNPRADEPLKFTSHKLSAELPIRGVIDPIGNDLQRLAHLERAHVLLGKGASANT